MKRISKILPLALALLAFTSPSQGADETLTFEKLQGKWTGFGWFYFGIDKKERGRCQALIAEEPSEDQGDKHKGKIDLKCKAETLEIDASAYNIVSEGPNLTGEWTMRSHEVDGDLKGNMTSDTMNAKMIPIGQTEDGFGAQLTTKLNDKCNATIKIDVDSPIDINKIDVKVRRC